MRRSSKLPKDMNQRAAEIVRLSTTEETTRPTQSIKDYLASIGRKGGLKGGKARKEALSAHRRREIAQKAAKIRWSQKKLNSKP